jgi:hypothetical protein
MAGQQFGGTAPGMQPPGGYSNGRAQSPLMGEFGLSPVMQRPQFGGTPIPQIPQFGVAELPPELQSQPQMMAQAGTSPAQGGAVAPPNVFQQSAGGLTGAMAGTQREMGFNPQSVSRCLPMQPKQMPWGFRRHLYHRLDITRH